MYDCQVTEFLGEWTTKSLHWKVIHGLVSSRLLVSSDFATDVQMPKLEPIYQRSRYLFQASNRLSAFPATEYPQGMEVMVKTLCRRFMRAAFERGFIGPRKDTLSLLWHPTTKGRRK